DVKGWAKDMVDALSAGVRGALPVIAVCAAAGVITSTITKTGLGLELADALVELAGLLSDNGTVVLILTVLLSAIAGIVVRDVDGFGLEAPRVGLHREHDAEVVEEGRD
ncbi:TRAP transporter large permease subunit, partial [Amycolatopsis kentuckyensis]|uniref:TRAP transporter large permease subunit n=1 Tax=Amycolatopsis kentuckyensis TaxID=218823 RepID=UPI001FC9F8A3